MLPIAIGGPLSAQNRHTKNSEVNSEQAAPANRSAGDSHEMQPIRVTLVAKDSSLRYVMTELARQGGVRLVYRNASDAMAHRVTVHIVNMDLHKAFEAALHGTGLVAAFAPDGKTVGIRAVRDTVSDGDSTASRSGMILGRVVDSASGDGISGATVFVLGTNNSTVTRAHGSFQLTNVPVGKHSVSVKLIGYRSEVRMVTVEPGRAVPLAIALPPTSTTLSEVVTTATGQQKRFKVANDIAKINADSIMQQAPIRSVTDLIEAAHVPGVQVTPTSGDPGAPARIRMRGIGSISQNNDPVVIVDGVWVNAATSTNAIVQQAAIPGHNSLVPSQLDNIDPSSIESIEIIRGPSAAALYGQDAANGVIVITTKHGHAGKARWHATMSRDWSGVTRDPAPKWEGFGQAWPSGGTVSCNLDQISAGLCVQDSVVNVNSNAAFLRNTGPGYTNRVTLGMDGGSDQLLYSLNGTFQNQLGNKRLAPVDATRLDLLNVPMTGDFLRPNALKQTTMSAQLSAQPVQSVQVALTINGSQNQQRDNVTQLTQFNFIDPRDTVYFLQDPTGRIDQEKDGTQSSSVLLGLSSSWNPTAWFRGAVQGGLQRTERQDDALLTTRTCSLGDCQLTDLGQRRAYQTVGSVYTARLQLSAEPDLGVFNRFLSLRPGFGIDVRRNTSSSLSIIASNLAAGSSDITTAQQINGTAQRVGDATAGWYLTTTVGVLNRLYFDVGLRQDIGSAITVSSGARYPKFGVSWVASDEPWFPATSWLSTLRLRAALGHAAVQPSITDIRGSYINGQSYINGKVVQTFDLNGIGNSTLVPERAIELEGGFDADLLRDRVQVSLTMAQKTNRNDLINRNLAGSVGLASSTRKENVAKVINRSLEFSMTARVIDNSLALWTVNTSMSGLDNRVVKLGNGVSPFGTDEARIVAGYPVDGVWEQPVLGFNDTNHDGIIESNEVVYGDSSVYIGWVQPRFSATYGTQLSLWQRRVTIGASFAYQGEYVQNQLNYDGLGIWSPSASLAEQALAKIAQGVGNRQTISDLRFSSANINVTLPQSFANFLKARTTQLSFQASNLALWTNYRGRDPGVNSRPVGEQLQDNGNILPPPRTFSLTLQLGY